MQQYTQVAGRDLPLVRGASGNDEFDEEDQPHISPHRSPKNLAESEKDMLVEKEAGPAAAEALQTFITSGNFLRLTILVAVTMQNTSYALVRRYSRGHLKETYSTSSVLLAMEVSKLLLSAVQLWALELRLP